MEKLKKIGKFVPAALFALPLVTFAAVILPAGTALTLANIQTVIETVANFLIVIGVVIAVIFIIWGGLKYMMAKGDPTKAKAAKDSIIHGIIGAAIVLGVGVILSTTAGLVTRSFFGS